MKIDSSRECSYSADLKQMHRSQTKYLAFTYRFLFRGGGLARRVHEGVKT